MRTLFLVLVLANAAFYAWSQYFAPFDAGADPRPYARQIEPEKLKLVAARELEQAPMVQKKPPAATVCLEWGSFTLADAPRAEKALEPLGLGARVVQRRTEEMAGWWVHIPPQRTRQAALGKAAELKALGVQDYFVVNEEGPFRWALSLGVFRSQEAAQARLDALHAQGVSTARIAARDTLVPKVWLQIKSVDASLEPRLKELTARMEGSELRPCTP